MSSQPTSAASRGKLEPMPAILTANSESFTTRPVNIHEEMPFGIRVAIGDESIGLGVDGVISGAVGILPLRALSRLPSWERGQRHRLPNELESSSELLLGQARLWCALRTRHASPIALEPPQLCTDPTRLLSSQRHLSSLSLHRSDCRFGDPARRTHRHLQR